MPAVVLGERDRDAWYHGRSVQLSRNADPSPAIVRAYAGDGRFLGVGKWTDDDWLKPTLVLPVEDEGEEP